MMLGNLLFLSFCFVSSACCCPEYFWNTFFFLWGLIRNRYVHFHVFCIQQCNKKLSAFLRWILKSAGVIENRPWPRIMITLITTAVILTMAVFNMVGLNKIFFYLIVLICLFGLGTLLSVMREKKYVSCMD